MFHLLFALYATLSFGESTIIGGKPVPEGKFKNVVALYNQKNNFFCSGTLIHPKLVLTATHCIADPRLTAVNVHVGNGDINSKNLYPAAKVFSYSKTSSDFFLRNNQNEKLMHDIAIIVLKDAINDVPITKLITSPTVINTLAPRAPLLISGFGLDEKKQSGIKRYGKPELSSIAPHTNRLIINFTEEGSFATPYKGDSGGPVFVVSENNPIQIGVVSVLRQGQVHYTLPHKFLCWMEQKSKLEIHHQFDCQNSREQMPTNIKGYDFDF